MSYWKHGDAGGGKKAREYSAWGAMIQRCTNPKTVHYDRYGGRGIKVCDRWLNSYVDFLADMGRCPAGMEIERIDNDGNYEPGNCCWATRKAQNRNTSLCRLLTFRGQSLAVAEWAEILGINHRTIMSRLNMGWSEERALGVPVRPTKPKTRKQ